MRILYLGESLQIHDFRFIEKLVEKGYDTHVVTFTDKPIKLKGVAYHNFSMFEGPMSHSRFVGDIIYIKNLVKQRSFIQKLIDELKPDILHAGWIPSHGLMAAISGFHPFLLMPWGSDILVLPKESNFHRLITRFAIKKADMITCDAEHVKNEIIKLSGYPENKIIVFPQGIDLKKFNPKVNGDVIRKKLGWGDKKIIIMTRSFKKIYGVEYFLKSLLKLFEKDNNDVRILFCGAGPLKDEFVEYLSNKGLSKYVHFTGFIKNDELPKYLAAADIYVSTSLSDGTSLSLLEAMAVGLPCVVTDVPAIMEWIIDGKNGFVVPKKDSIILTERIIDLLKDHDLRNEFGNKNIKIALERADWDKNFEKLECMYNELIS